MIFTIDCEKCGGKHKTEIDTKQTIKAQRAGLEPFKIKYICPNVAYMYRVLGFALDARVTVFKDSNQKKNQDHIKKGLLFEWGEKDFELKLKRFIDLDVSFIGIPEEYYYLLKSVISSYCCGYFYSSITSAGALGERILNRLLIKTRHHFKDTEHYNKIKSKNSFDNWDIPIKVLKDWNIISKDVSKHFITLKKFRNDSLHYRDGYNFEKNAFPAIKALANIINHQFNYMLRKDLFWVFNVPGEIWLRSTTVNDPFIKEFVLEHCCLLTPLDEPTADPPIVCKKPPLKPLSDEDFIKLRNERNKQ